MVERESRIRHRGKGATALGAAVRRVTQPVFGKRGLADGAIAADWPAIVGPALARLSMPERIGYPTGERLNGILHLRVASGSLAVELQHLEPLVIERINGYFGYKAVARLRLIHGTIALQPEKPSESPRVLTAKDERCLTERLGGIEDPTLKARLQALGRAILERDSKAPDPPAMK